MRILIVNDDGINSVGIHMLAKAAKEFGSVTVVAPAHECSGMSQHISIFREMRLEKHSIPVEGVEAYSVSGTPADCVKVALDCVMSCKPDLLLSGINAGFNVGFDIAYSGTIGAALEGIMNRIPTIAFSNRDSVSFSSAESFLGPIIAELLTREISPRELWNVNLPGCPAEQVKGMLWNRTIAPIALYQNFFRCEENGSDSKTLRMDFTTIGPEKAPEDSDIYAVLNGYISIGRVASAVL